MQPKVLIRWTTSTPLPSASRQQVRRLRARQAAGCEVGHNKGLRPLLVGEILPAAGLAAWGALVVTQIDNLLRPLFISSAARIPYVLVLFAVLGGIAAFGLVGLFIGPIVIAILLAVWREWIAEPTPRG